MVRIENLQFRLGEKIILNDISIDFEARKIHGIIGPNGAGKSSLLKNIARIWEPQSGNIFIDGADYRDIPRKRLSTIVTLVPQNVRISFPISVYDIVAMGRHPHLGRFQALTRRDHDIIDRALRITRIHELRDRNINELSGGESQLSIIARALSTEASLILLDEPTSDLDIKHALCILDLLRDLKADGKTILVSVHDLNMARRYCDTISIINEGKVFFKGSPSEAFSQDKINAVFGVHMTEITDDDTTLLYFCQ